MQDFFRLRVIVDIYQKTKDTKCTPIYTKIHEFIIHNQKIPSYLIVPT